MTEGRGTVFGIDAGFAFLGVVVVDWPKREVLSYGVCRTTNELTKKGVRVADSDTERAMASFRFLRQIARGWSPAAMVVELPHGGARNARAARSMGIATGVVASFAEASQIPCEWVTPDSVKRAATGGRKATKYAVESGVRQEFEWPDVADDMLKVEREHVFDAAGALLAAQHGSLLRSLDEDRLGGMI